MRRLIFALTLLATVIVPVRAQNKQDAVVLDSFTKILSSGGLDLSVIYMNDKTVDVLFLAPSKFSMRVLAQQKTMMYIQGKAERDVNFNSVFSIEQDGKTIAGTSHSIQNFETKKVTKGQSIIGYVEFAEKVDPTRTFRLKGGKEWVEFKFSAKQLQ